MARLRCSVIVLMKGTTWKGELISSTPLYSLFSSGSFFSVTIYWINMNDCPGVGTNHKANLPNQSPNPSFPASTSLLLQQMGHVSTGRGQICVHNVGSLDFVITNFIKIPQSSFISSQCSCYG